MIAINIVIQDKIEYQKFNIYIYIYKRLRYNIGITNTTVRKYKKILNENALQISDGNCIVHDIN